MDINWINNLTQLDDQKSKGAQSNANAAPKYPFDMKSLIDAGGLCDLDAHLADLTYVMGGPEATSADAVAYEVRLAA